MFNFYLACMDYPNDRKLLVLLSHIEKLNSKQMRMYRSLSTIYTDNSYYLRDIQQELVALKFLSVEYEVSETGAIKAETIMHDITPTGIGAISSGRFPSEQKANGIAKRNFWVGWSTAIIGGIGGIFGILSALNAL